MQASQTSGVESTNVPGPGVDDGPFKELQSCLLEASLASGNEFSSGHRWPAKGSRAAELS